MERRQEETGDLRGAEKRRKLDKRAINIGE